MFFSMAPLFFKNLCDGLEGHAERGVTHSYAADPASSWSNPRDVIREQHASALAALVMRYVGSLGFRV